MTIIFTKTLLKSQILLRIWRKIFKICEKYTQIPLYRGQSPKIPPWTSKSPHYRNPLIQTPISLEFAKIKAFKISIYLLSTTLRISSLDNTRPKFQKISNRSLRNSMSRIIIKKAKRPKRLETRNLWWKIFIN